MGGRIYLYHGLRDSIIFQLSSLLVSCGEAEHHDRDHELEQNFSSHVQEIKKTGGRWGQHIPSKACPHVTFFNKTFPSDILVCNNV